MKRLLPIFTICLIWASLCLVRVEASTPEFKTYEQYKKEAEAVKNLTGSTAPIQSESDYYKMQCAVFSLVYINAGLPIPAECDKYLEQPKNNAPAPTPVTPIPTPEVENPPVYTQPKREEANNKTLSIYKVEPLVVSAGKGRFDQSSGIVTFEDNNLILSVNGTGLSGATFRSSSIGIDGRLGIMFGQVQVNSQGTNAQVQMSVKPTAKDGSVAITLTNAQGESANFNITVTISGNQFLNRAFSNSLVKFYGEWPEVNDQVKYLAKQVQDGAEFMSHGEYKKLNINLSVFETKFWESGGANKYCGGGNNSATKGGFTVGGCAQRGTPYIYLAERTPSSVTSMKQAIVHESAHKLEAYYNNFYSYRFYVSILAGLNAKWKNAVGDLSKCQSLPIKNGGWANDPNQFNPHCGFVMAYGATNLTTYAEDIATFTEIYIMKPEFFTKGEALTDPRYKAKLDLLKTYGFVP